MLEVLRLPSPSATSPLRHHSLSSRYRRHAPLSIDHPQRRTRLFGWMQGPYSTEMENSEPADVAMSFVGEEEVTKETEPTFGMQTNLVDVPSEAVVRWETTMPTTGAPSSPQALVGSSVTASPRSPPPRRRRPPPPVAARKQVGREHVLPLEVGFYVSLSGTFAHDSRLSIVFTAFSYMDCFTGTDFLCKNHRCIPGALTCDGFDHCGDASDEPPSCLENGEGNGPMEGGGNMGMIGGMGGDSGIDRHWYSHTPNYYFPKMERYPDLKTATLVFIVSSLGLILLIAALIILLYRMGSRARQHRELQNRLQTISDLLGEYDGARIEEISTDDPPDYEAPPTYEDVVKAVNGPNGDCCSTSGLVPAPEEDCPIRAKERIGEGRRRARPRAGSNPTSSSYLQDDSDSSLPPPDISALIPPPPPPPLHTSSRSCQTTLIPDSPPPTYETALLRASRSLQANILQNTSPPLFPAISSGPHSGFNSAPSTAPSSLPYMQTVPEGPERYLSTSETEDGHSIMTDASLLDGGEMEQQISIPDMTGSENENQDPGEGTSAEGSPAPEEPPQNPEDSEVSAKPTEEGSKEETVEETGEAESGRDQANEASSSTQAPGSDAEADGVAKAKSEGEEKPETERESEKKQGEVEIDKTEPEIDKSLPGRSSDVMPMEASSSTDKIELSVLVEDDNKKEDEETVGKEVGTTEEQKDDSGVKEEEGDGNESEEECSERQKLIDRSKEVGEEGVSLREGNEVDEVGEDALEVKEILKEGNEREKKGTKLCKGKEEVKEASNSSRVVKDSSMCASSCKEGELSKSSKEQKEPLPHEIVGGLVKGHIKLFQGMSSSKDEDEGEARVLRRRVAMRGWRSVDVGCGERLLEN
ncbi:hypothetical protein J437_LFUL003517 [Ladona fulva]|uniref:Uncharacterized protein n=1 Tax=Ladona fulva TaxID=123851 RepID=A0A8K0JUE9_LADFU|nr:hypothetical protein J437_LFUL003517 [Ladona fulva]